MLFFGVPLLSAQQVSVLPQFFSANPIIKRDPTFEQLQKYLSDANKKTTLGLNENITKKLKELRLEVENMKLEFSIIKDVGGEIKNNKIHVEWAFLGKDENGDVIKIGDIDVVAEREKLISVISNFITDPVLNKYPVVDGSGSTLIRFNKLVLFLVLESLKAGDMAIINFNDDLINNDEFKKEIKTSIETYLNAQLDEFIKTTFPADVKEEDYFRKKIVVSFNGLIENMKSKISEGLYQLDESIQKSKADLSKRLLSANTGVGINQDEGSFGGGLLLTWVAKDLNNGNSTQFSVFTNGVGQVGKDSTATKQPFLCGVNFEQQIGHRTQVSFLASTRYNQQSLNGKNWLFEGGLGFLTKSPNNLIWGVSAFYQYINESVKTYDKTVKEMVPVQVYSLFTAGITFRGDSNTSPTVLVGVSNQKGWTPTLQISYPINFTKQ
jgi:hypothetical protein